MNSADLKAVVQTALTGGAIAIAAFVDAGWKPFAVLAFVVIALVANRWGVFSREVRLETTLKTARNTTFDFLIRGLLEKVFEDDNIPSGSFRATLFTRRDFLGVSWLTPAATVGWRAVDSDSGLNWWYVPGFRQQGLVWQVCHSRSYGLYLRNSESDPRVLFGLSSNQAKLTADVAGILAFSVSRADNAYGGRAYAVISIDTASELGAEKLRQVAEDIENNADHPCVTLVDQVSRFIA